MGFDLFGNIGTAVGAPIAAKMQRTALENARNTQQQQYQTNKGYYDPYYSHGTAAMNSLYGNVQNGAYDVNVSPQDLASDPGFQFRMEQGQKAMERSAAARGGLNSGGFAKGLADYSQGLASQEYGNIWNRKFQQNQFNYNSLANLAGMGERAAGNLAGLGERYGGTMAGYDMDLGNINAAAIMNQFQAGGRAADAGSSMAIDLAAGGATGGAGGLGGLLSGGGGGGGGQYLSAGNPYSMQPMAHDTGWGPPSQSLGSIGAIPVQGGSYGGGQGAIPQQGFGYGYGPGGGWGGY